MKKRIECMVTGRVQFVTYRYFTMRKAKQFGIVGTVENLKDGSVHVVAEGEESKLGEFISGLKKGPIFAHVEEVKIVPAFPTGEFNDFHIIY